MLLLSWHAYNAPQHKVPWPKQRVSNFIPSTETYIEFGRQLFFDPLLSADGSVSCANCHSPFNAFSHSDHKLSHGIHDSIVRRNAPALINLAWNELFMWDGAIDHIKAVSLAPINNPREMGSSTSNVINKINQSEYYTNQLRAIELYPINAEIFTSAMAAFLLSLVSSDSRYDKMNRGEIIFTAQEEKGYNIFKTQCNSCHSEPLFTNGKLEKNGLPIDSFLVDFGVEEITHQPEDRMKFKVPTLRNLKYSKPYMHDGRFSSLNDVVIYYASHENSPVEFPISDNDRVDLLVFLNTLNDSTFIFNPKFHYPN